MTKDRIVELIDTFKGDRNGFVSAIKSEIDTEIDDAVKEALEGAEWEDSEIEKVGCNFVVEQFFDCLSLEDFREKYLEIQRRSFNFM